MNTQKKEPHILVVDDRKQEDDILKLLSQKIDYGSEKYSYEKIYKKAFYVKKITAKKKQKTAFIEKITDFIKEFFSEDNNTDNLAWAELLKKENYKHKDYIALEPIHYKTMMNYIEDLEDRLAIQKFEESDEETFPLELVKALIKTPEKSVQLYREYRSLTQEQLAEKAGVGRPMLAQIETGRKKGSIITLKKIAAALDVDLEDIV